jgi:hypothetical protein
VTASTILSSVLPHLSGLFAVDSRSLFMERESSPIVYTIVHVAFVAVKVIVFRIKNVACEVPVSSTDRRLFRTRMRLTIIIYN